MKVAMDNIMIMEIRQAVRHLFDLAKESKVRTTNWDCFRNSQGSACQQSCSEAETPLYSHDAKMVRPKPLTTRGWYNSQNKVASEGGKDVATLLTRV
jgi:hypothetical protein